MRELRKTSREGVKQRRRAASLCNVVVLRRRLTSLRDVVLSCCHPASCSYLPVIPLDRATLHTWLHHWQDEYDAAYLYLVLAGQEPDPKRKDVYIKLAGVEERHVQMWDELLAHHGHRVGRPRP